MLLFTNVELAENCNFRLSKWPFVGYFVCEVCLMLRVPIVEVTVCESQVILFDHSHKRNAQQSATYRCAVVKRGRTLARVSFNFIFALVYNAR